MRTLMQKMRVSVLELGLQQVLCNCASKCCGVVQQCCATVLCNSATVLCSSASVVQLCSSAVGSVGASGSDAYLKYLEAHLSDFLICHIFSHPQEFEV